MKDTPEVREALQEIARMLGNIAQSKVNAAKNDGSLESLVLVTQGSGMAQAAVLVQSAHDALVEKAPINLLPKKPSVKAKAKLFVM